MREAFIALICISLVIGFCVSIQYLVYGVALCILAISLHGLENKSLRYRLRHNVFAFGGLGILCAALLVASFMGSIVVEHKIVLNIGLCAGFLFSALRVLCSLACLTDRHLYVLYLSDCVDKRRPKMDSDD